MASLLLDFSLASGELSQAESIVDATMIVMVKVFFMRYHH